MLIRSFQYLIVFLSLFAPRAVHAQQQLSAIGWQADLSDNLASVGVGGTATIRDRFTLEFENFSYDGRGAGEADIVLLPFVSNQTGGAFTADEAFATNAQVRFRSLGDYFFDVSQGTQLDVSTTIFEDLRGDDRRPGLPPSGGDSPPITGADFILSLDRSDFAPGPQGDLGLLGFSTLSVFCHPAFVDFGSGVFLPPPPGSADPNADFNTDGFVDGQDFLQYQRNFGSNSPPSAGDANGDGVVNSEDLDLFSTQFGTIGGGELPPTFDEVFPNFFAGRNAALLSGATIPEPTSCLLLGLAGGLLLMRRQRRTIEQG